MKSVPFSVFLFSSVLTGSLGVGLIFGGWFGGGLAFVAAASASMYGHTFASINPKNRRRWLFGGPFFLLMFLGVNGPLIVVPEPTFYPHFLQAISFALLLGGLVGFVKGRYDWKSRGIDWMREEKEWFERFQEGTTTRHEYMLEETRARSRNELGKIRAVSVQQLLKKLSERAEVIETAYRAETSRLKDPLFDQLLEARLAPFRERLAEVERTISSF